MQRKYIIIEAIENFDKKFHSFTAQISLQLSRLSIFIIFFWFGILKILGMSPADRLVEALHQKTISFIPYNEFLIFLGIFEIIIGIFFLVPRLNRYAIYILLPQMFTTFLPLIFLPDITWHKFLSPTLEGQYIVKNLIIISLALSIYLQPRSTKTRKKTKEKSKRK